MIKNLVFDVGGVLLEYRCLELLMEYGLSEEEAVLTADRIFDDAIWANRVDRGTLSLEDAMRELGGMYPEAADAISWFLQHGERMMLHHPEIWDKVAQLKRLGYRIYILSNYSEKLFRLHTQGASFLDILDGGVVSYQVGYVKPEEDIYRVFLEKYDLRAEECIFYDDRLENVETAVRMGMQGVWVKAVDCMNEILDQRIREGILFPYKKG